MPNLIQSLPFSYHEGRYYMTSDQLGKQLGLKHPRQAVTKILRRNAEELKPFSGETKLVSPGGMQLVTTFDEQGCYIVAMLAKTPAAKEFRKKLAYFLKSLRERKLPVLSSEQASKELAQLRLEQFIKQSPSWTRYKLFRYKELERSGLLNYNEIARALCISIDSLNRMRRLLTPLKRSNEQQSLLDV